MMLLPIAQNNDKRQRHENRIHIDEERHLALSLAKIVASPGNVDS